MAAMVWHYLLMAIGLTAAILFGCCVVMDYSTYTAPTGVSRDASGSSARRRSINRRSPRFLEETDRQGETTT